MNSHNAYFLIEIFDPNRTSAKGLVKWVSECDFDQSALKIATVDTVTGPYDVIIHFELIGPDRNASLEKLAAFFLEVQSNYKRKEVRVTTCVGDNF